MPPETQYAAEALDGQVTEAVEEESSTLQNFMDDAVEVAKVLAQEIERMVDNAINFLPSMDLCDDIEKNLDQIKRFQGYKLNNQLEIKKKDVAEGGASSVPVRIGETVPNNKLEAKDAKRVFEKNFNRLDTDGNGYVSEEEIDKAMVNPAFKGEDAALVAMLKAKRTDLEELSDDEWFDENSGVSKADITKLDQIQAKSNQDEDEANLVNDVNWRLSEAHKYTATGVPELFGNKDNPLESIKPEGVIQGQIGDCYFVAALAALAGTAEGKESIKSMIKTNEDGTYTVTFPGAPDKPVTVSAPTEAELARYAHGNEHGMWAALLEKAYGKYCNDNKIVAQDGIRNGSINAAGLQILTGKEIDTDVIALTSQEDTHRKLSEAKKDGRPVTCATRNEVGRLIGAADNLTDDAGIPGGHLYTVTDYDPAGKMVTIRNPWGYGEPMNADGTPKDGKNDGVFKMSLDEFERNFNRVSYVEK